MKHVVLAVIRNNENKFLLVESKRDFGVHTGALYPPGGKMEPGETKSEALIRELQEELGAEVLPIRELAVTAADVPDQMTYWWECELRTDPLCFQIREEEIGTVQFFSRDEMSSIRLWPATEKFFQSHIDAPKISRERE